MLKLFVTMEVIQWDAFWSNYEGEFSTETLGEKAFEDLRQRAIEHVRA